MALLPKISLVAVYRILDAHARPIFIRRTARAHRHGPSGLGNDRRRQYDPRSRCQIAADRERALRAFEVATLLARRRALPARVDCQLPIAPSKIQGAIASLRKGR